MAKQYSLAQLTAMGCAPPELTYIAARAGYDYVSYRIIYMNLPGEPNYELAAPQNKEMLKQTKTALAATGVKLLDVEYFRILDDVDVKSYVPALEVAAELGCKQVLSCITSPQWNYAVDACAELCDLAKPYGLTINVEFLPFVPVSNLQQTVKFLREVNKDNSGVLLDTLHFHLSRVNLEELDDVPRAWFNVAHLCDAPAEIPDTREGQIQIARGARLYIGEGGIDIAGILNRIPEVPCSIELPNHARAKELGYAEHAARCIESARKYFAAHPRS